MRPALRRTAVVLMLVGAMALVSSSLAGVAVVADRDTSVSVASDPNGVLGIDAVADIGQLKGNSGAVEIGTLTNRLGETATVEVIVVEIPNADNGILSTDPKGLDVADGDSTSATVACAQSQSPGQRDVVFGVEAVGSNVSVTSATFTVSMDIKCGSGNIQPIDSGLGGVSATNLTGDASQPQTFEFQLTEDLASGETVTITVVDGNKNKRVDYTGATFSTGASGTITAEPSNNGNGNDYIVTFDPDQSVSAGETIQISASGVDASGNQASDKSPYTVRFQRSDKSASESTSFGVS